MYKATGLLVVGMLFCGTALGGLATDPNAYTDINNFTWHGMTQFYTEHPSNPQIILAADVEWCVYAPGDFSYGGLGYTPTLGEFTYAYQVIPTGTLEVNTFWVNMLASNEADNIGSFTLPGGIVPSGAAFGSVDPENLVSANWTFAGNLVPSTVSDGLAYSSINAPIMYVGFIQDGGLVGMPSGPLPSPSDVIPEPVTVAVLLLAAGAVLMLRARGK